MNNTPPSVRSAIVKSLIAFAIAAGIIAFLFWYTGTRRGPTQADRETFFKESVTPVLGTNASANAKALEVLKSDIHAQFEQYRHRVPTFTADITGFGNKAKITWEAMKQMTSEDKKKVERHVTEKFEMHVVSATKMQQDLETLLKGFRRDIEANRNRMLVDIEAAVKADSQFSAHGIRLQETFAKDIEAKISELAKKSGNDVAILTSLNLIASMAADIAVTELVSVALTRVGTSLAATIAASGGTAAAMTAGGGTVGTTGGPAGVVIGLAAGLTVGIIVDIVMDNRLESKLNEECSNFLTNSEVALIKNPDGLVSSIGKALAEFEKVKAPVIKQQLVLP